MLSFLGDNEVYGLMQTVNHRTRAFIVNASGLKVFLQPCIINTLKRQIKAESRVEVQKYKFVKLDVFLNTLGEIRDQKEIMKYLKERYPNLAMFLLKRFGKKTELQ